jgi:hypothetical protein
MVEATAFSDWCRIIDPADGRTPSVVVNTCTVDPFDQ